MVSLSASEPDPYSGNDPGQGNQPEGNGPVKIKNGRTQYKQGARVCEKM